MTAGAPAVTVFVHPEIRQALDEMQHEGWLDETANRVCVACGKSLRGGSSWYLALDTEHPDGCSDGYVCGSVCLRYAVAILRKDRRIR